MFPAAQVADELAALGVTHIVWLPDTALGEWESVLESDPRFKLLRICREGEAWPLAAGLYMGGAVPLVMIQTTGLLESGDSLRNTLFDLKVPLFALIGYRSYLVADSPDSAKRFAGPILDAWGIDYVLLDTPESFPKLSSHWHACREAGKPGFALLAEGKM